MPRVTSDRSVILTYRPHRFPRGIHVFSSFPRDFSFTGNLKFFPLIVRSVRDFFPLSWQGRARCAFLHVDDVHNSTLCIITSRQATLSSWKGRGSHLQRKTASHGHIHGMPQAVSPVKVNHFVRFYTQIRYSLPGLFHMWKQPILAPGRWLLPRAHRRVGAAISSADDQPTPRDQRAVARSPSPYHGARAGGRLSPRFEFPGALVTPGLVDGHTHLALWALNRRRVELTGSSTREEVVARVAAARPIQGWIIGQGWDANGWPGAPDRFVLDRVQQAPVYLDSSNVHAGRVGRGSGC